RVGQPLQIDVCGYNRRSVARSSARHLSRLGSVVVFNLRGPAVALPLFLTRLLIRTGLARYLPGVQRLTDGGSDFLRYYSDRVLDAPRRDLRRIAALLEQQPPDAIDLSLGSPRFELTAPSVPRLLADRRGWPPPWGLPELRAAVAERLLTDNQVAVSPADEVLITAGAAGAVHTVPH